MASEIVSVSRDYYQTNKYSLVLVTVPEADVADELAQSVIKQKLGAVVNILPPMRSFRASKKYDVKSEKGIMMMIKAPTCRVERLVAFLVLNSPVDIEKSDITSVLINNGNAAFYNWMRETTLIDPHSDDESMEQTKSSVSEPTTSEN